MNCWCLLRRLRDQATPTEFILQETVILMERYGGDVIPEPPPDTTESIFTRLMEVNADVIADPMYNIVDRTDVNQGPLLKVNKGRNGGGRVKH